MTIAKQLEHTGIKKGIEIGRQEGKLEGRLEGKLEVARAMLHNGFGCNIMMNMAGLSADDFKQNRQ